MKSTYLVVGFGVIIVAIAVFYFYSADQAKIRGFNFGNSLDAVQGELKQVQTDFYSKKRLLDENTITKEEFLEFSEEHVEKMEEMVSKYESLVSPNSFVKAVELFKTSTQKQLESDRFLIEWIRTNDTSDRVRSDLLLQESFENEMAALSSFEKAKNSSGQD
ncbi:MAG TPA: hypothetical protein VGA92_09720 [Candidatus Nitrosotenuis sp.]